LALDLKTNPSQIQERIRLLQTQIQDLERQNQQLLQGQLLSQAKAAIMAQRSQNRSYLILDCGAIDAKSLRMMSDACRDIEANWAYVLYAGQEQQVQVIVTIPKDLQAKLGAAGDWVKRLCHKGGGRPDFAQGGGSKGEEFNQELKLLEQSFAEKLA
jgi:alanyl-tRNA synthetase